MKKVIGSVVAIATHMPPRSLVADEEFEEASEEAADPEAQNLYAHFYP